MKNHDTSRIIKRRIVRSLKLRLPSKYRAKIEKQRENNEKRWGSKE